MGEQARRTERLDLGAPSTDFDTAVAAAVDAKFEAFRDELLKATASNSGLGLLGPVMEQLGMKIADIADQNNGRIGQRIDPEILRQRETARTELVETLETLQRSNADLRARGLEPELPFYRLKNVIQLNHSAIQPFYIDPATKSAKETEIGFDGIPNEAMIPINDLAKRVYAIYRTWIGNLKKVVPEDRLGITSTGVTVRNGAVQTRMEMRRGDENAADLASRTPNVTVSHLQKGRGTAKHILGSIHPPALIVG